MADIAMGTGNGALAAKKERHWTSSISLVILYLFCGASIFLMLCITPKFEQIFADALPGQPLPGLTAFILSSRGAIALFDLCGPTFCTYLFRKEKPHAARWINVGILFYFLQIATTTYALFAPMNGVVVGMSDAKP